MTDPRAEPVVTFVTAGGAHIPASETWTPAIVAVEIVRFDGRARVTLDGERRVRLAPLWENHFQNWAFAQSLHIDLIGEDRSGEACAPLPAAVDSAWSIAPE